ncbi:ferritin light chain [Desmodus rotundus]|uniref:ferritin light chain n=1 Tax=Desmodus rotundus TaxID=9430 RepID=UPI00238166EE|nr:ferritin light chain [Desmodus rotundus]
MGEPGGPVGGQGYVFQGAFASDEMTLESMGHFFQETAKEKHKDAKVLSKIQSQWSSCSLIQKGKKQSQDGYSGSVDTMEAAKVLEKNLSQAFLDLHALGSASTDHHHSDFLKSHFLENEVKLIKKMGDHLTNLYRLAGPQGRLSKYLFKRLTHQHD